MRRTVILSSQTVTLVSESNMRSSLAFQRLINTSLRCLPQYFKATETFILGIASCYQHGLSSLIDSSSDNRILQSSESSSPSGLLIFRYLLVSMCLIQQ
ncbi:hypothetical protein FGO68_gene170 [Halteria grandinella]|uniref:Uncharacterized protein n=1 Tax=Halteria grandinella TaxID=5974 RepID=A0A8J8NP49_HALGN|nr:hypothetical protein FGO68_gene170 [Halteria grandinella]